MCEWHVVEADPLEAALFTDLPRVRALVTGPAAPPNRFRQVHVVRSGDRVWYLKEFRHTQWKNRWRNRCSRPRCTLDAERELLVARELRRRGIGIARPVAWGRDGPASYYLCAALPGESLKARAAERRVLGSTRRAAAEFVGRVLCSGVRLPDLSAEHVYLAESAADGAAPDDAAPENAAPASVASDMEARDAAARGGDAGSAAGFAVIDLHNGGLGRPSQKLAARILKRFVRSLRGVPVERAVALRFAIRALARAGFDTAARRRIVGRVPPPDTHGRYEVAGRAAAYGRRNPARTARELRLLQQVWPGEPGASVLDSPCGTGRLAQVLGGELGCARVGADRAMAMLRASRAGGDADSLVQADARRLPFGGRSFDGVVVFRLLHHLPPDAAQEVVAEAARVARSFVVLTFFHPVSVHGATRRLRVAWSGRAPTRFSVTHRKLSRWMRECGFEAFSHAAESAFLRDFRVAAFRRSDGGRR